MRKTHKNERNHLDPKVKKMYWLLVRRSTLPTETKLFL
jgi:hypothetical protein